MIDPKVIDHRLLTATELAAVVLQMRREKGWTQETLAELARVSVRTVQRLEEGQPSSLDTRRTVAGAFDFDDLDIFSKPWPVPNVEKLREESARIERETIAVKVVALTKGRQLRELAEQASSFLVTSTDEPGDEVELLMAGLRDFFSEYGDSHDLYPETGKVEVSQVFQGYIDDLASKGVGLVGGLRKVSLRYDNMPADEPAIPMDVVYVVSGPLAEVPEVIRVPRRGRFGF